MPHSLVIDSGNTRVKLGLFHDAQLRAVVTATLDNLQFQLDQLLYQSHPSHCILSDTGGKADAIQKLLPSSLPVVSVSRELHFPFTNAYATPETLGQDRMVLASAGVRFTAQFREKFSLPFIDTQGVKECLDNRVSPFRESEILRATNTKHNPERAVLMGVTLDPDDLAAMQPGGVLIIDIGSCITYDYINADQVYLGGAISPGVRMRYEAMHTMTASLPLVLHDDRQELIGTSTETSMQSGVLQGTIGELDHVINQYRALDPNLITLITGGGLGSLASRLKNRTFAAPNLMLYGLRELMHLNQPT